MSAGVVLTLLLASALLLVAELAARRWIRRRTKYFVWEPGRRIEMRPRPTLFPQVEARARFDVNADGERGSEAPRAPSEAFRILVAGGSAVECLVLDQPTSWPGALERRLNDDASLRALGAPRVHVGNIGRSGLESRHLDLIFERVLPQYPKLGAIVIMVGAADVIFWLEQGAPVPLRTTPVSAHETFALHPEQTFGWTPKRWASAEIVRRVRRSRLRPVEVRANSGGWIEEARLMRACATDLRGQVPDAEDMLDRFEENFRRALVRAQAHARHVIVVRQPWFEKRYTPEERAHFWHGGVGRAWKERISTYYSLEVVNCLMGLVDARATRVAEELDIAPLELRRVLTPTLDHFYDYLHMTPLGAGIAAAEIAKAVLRAATPARSTRPAIDASAIHGRAPSGGADSRSEAAW